MWSLPSVQEALIVKFDEMYQTINTYVNDVYDASYQIEKLYSGKIIIKHDEQLKEQISSLDAFSFPQ